MNYKDCLAAIEKKNALGSRPGLSTIQEMLNRLGSPEKGIPAIQIAGTNGKGSILAYTESILTEAGILTGRYVSPAVFDYRDKYLIGGKRISEEMTAEILSAALRVSEEMVRDGLPEPTAFETETAAAFLLYRKMQCDVILVECGMGGALDATNVLEENKTSVLASVSLDHLGILGNTVEEIADTKLGITRKGETLIVFPEQEDGVKGVIRSWQEKNHLHVIYPDLEKLQILSETAEESRFSYRGIEYLIRLPGRHQILNAMTALEICCTALADRQTEKGNTMIRWEKTLQDGLRKTAWPGRWTIIDRNPMVILDGAHNEKAWLVLADNVRRLLSGKKIFFLTGVFRDKEYDKMTRILAPLIHEAAVITPPGARGLPAEELARMFRQKGTMATAFDEYREALQYLKASAGADDVILCTGSLSFLGELMKLVKGDSPNIIC